MNDMLNILIIDDEADMGHLIEMYLGNSGFTCFLAESGVEAYGILGNNMIDLVILDIMMPDEDGFEVCSQIRKKSNVPIIFLSAKGEEWDKVKALQLGGDDYIVKPFSPGELIARINAVLRRTGGLKDDLDSVQIGQITIDKKARKVTVEGKQVTLTLKEYELLLFFYEHKNQALRRGLTS